MEEEKNARTIVQQLGTINIADEVVSSIAGMAAGNVDGVASMQSGFVGGIASSFGRKSTKGVKVDTGEEDLAIDLAIKVKYGYLIPDVTKKIQDNVKKNVEDFTGLKVAQINIHVQGLELSEKSDEDKAEQTN